MSAIRRRKLACGTEIQVIRGDITAQDTDAIVNAANAQLKGGGGVDGAIHRAGGPEIMEECRKIGGCPPGFAVVTTAGRLKAKYVIHTVGPIYSGIRQDPITLTNAYRNSMQKALTNGCASISFPSISTGVYGYPIEQAAPIAINTCVAFVRDNPQFASLRFILFSDSDYALYCRLVDALKD
jgi:O-acetyl-ADP-ribose deacetylase (regulator of RNase III)